MARRPAATDALLALALGVEMQLELFLADGPARDLLIARAAMLALAAAVAIRRRAPVLATAVAVVVSIVLERLPPEVSGNLVGPFFATLIVAFSVGAHAHGRRLAAGLAVLVVAAPCRSASTSRRVGPATSCSRARSSSPGRCCSAA